MEKERPRLDRGTPATFARNHTRVLVHSESCLQGLEIPAIEPTRADSDNRDCIRGITEVPVRAHSELDGTASHGPVTRVAAEPSSC